MKCQLNLRSCRLFFNTDLIFLLRFLMEDLVIKLESVHGIRKFIKDQQNQYISFPSELINDIVIFLPKIMEIFTNVSYIFLLKKLLIF